jgi:hypothetical protein
MVEAPGLKLLDADKTITDIEVCIRLARTRSQTRTGFALSFPHDRAFLKNALTRATL